MVRKEEFQKMVDESGSRFKGCKVDDVYRIENDLGKITTDLIAASEKNNLRVFVDHFGVAVCGRFEEKRGETAYPIALIINAERFGVDRYYAYLITIDHSEEQRNYLGPDVLQILKKYIA